MFEERLRKLEKQEQYRVVHEAVACVDGYQDMNQALTMLQEAATMGRADTFLLSEFRVTVQEVLTDLEKLKAFSQQTQAQVIIAPATHRGGYEHITWPELRAQFVAQGCETEEALPDDTENIQSVGVYIGPDKVYAFPKRDGGSNPLHTIPGTRIGVLICAEIAQLTEGGIDGLENIDIIYNPSSEKDDIYAKYRMELRSGVRTPEEIRQEIMSKPYVSAAEAMALDKTPEPYKQELIAAGVWEIDEEKERKTWQAGVDKDLDKIFNQGFDSTYARNLPEELRKEIPIVRTDGVSTGLLNEVNGLTFQKVEYNGPQAFFEFSHRRPAAS